METRIIAGQLRRCTLLRHFDASELEKLALMVEVRTFDPGEVIYAQGSQGESLFIVAQGEVMLGVDVEGAARTIVTLGPVESFGELGALVPCNRMLAAWAVQEVTLLEMTYGTLSMLETSDPKLALLLLGALRERLGERLRACQGLLRGMLVTLTSE